MSSQALISKKELEEMQHSVSELLDDLELKVTCLMALTLDGRIAKDSDHFPDWTEKADKKLFVQVTKRCGVMIMGSKTYDTIGNPLPGRKNIVLTRDKERVSNFENLIFTDKTPDQLLKNLKQEGYTEVALIGGTQINSLFAKAGLIDELELTITPVIFGEGLSLFTPEVNMDLELLETKPLGTNSVYVRYRVKK